MVWDLANWQCAKVSCGAPIKIINPAENFASEGFVTPKVDKTSARGQGETRVRQEQIRRRSRECDLPAQHSHPSPAPRHEDEADEARYLESEDRGRQALLQRVKRKLQAPVSQAAERHKEWENKTDKSKENSKTPAVSSSSSPRFQWCNLTPEEPRRADTQNQFQTCPAPTAASLPLLSLRFRSVFWYHLTLDSAARR
ncbi:hypothetical protein Q8A73_018700 [Channa argus]|nr:hypothetical protein Q8A73_018700 [Channa argus]